METQNLKIANSQSKIDWVGKKVTGSHNGTIEIKEGILTVKDRQITGGKFIIDIPSIKILDVTDPATNAQFAGHLASDDFFSTDKFPTATFEILSATHRGETAYHIEGNLTIKGITHPVTFDAQVKQSGDTLQASGKIVVDRTKYDMKFRSGNFFTNLGDTLIYNDFDLSVLITAKVIN
jgi:polyisoprenoid-binding protein YceI